mgnify:FL=1
MYTTSEDRIGKWVGEGFWGDKTLCDHLALQARVCSGRLAVIDPSNRMDFTGGDALRLTYGQLDAASDAMALDLMDAGLRHGQRVMLQMPNVVELVVCYFALSKLGVIVSPLPVQYQAHEIMTLSRAFRTEWFIGLADFRGTNLASNGVAAVASDRIITVGSDIRLRSLTGLSKGDAARLAAYRATNPTDANAIFTVCWTSGTTGTPKGVPRSHNMWLSSGQATASGIGFSAGDVLLNPFPMVNMSALGGFLFPATTMGCTLVLHHPLDVPVFLQQIQQEGVCFTIAPPALLNRLAKMPELWRRFDFPNLRAIGSGSAPLSPDMIRTFEVDYGVSVYNIYGSNEGIAFITSPDVVPDPAQRAVMFPHSNTDSVDPSSTKPSLMTKVIEPDSGTELETSGAIGELCVLGPTVFDGYLGSEDLSVFTPDGFFRTGDLVEITGEGGELYRIVGRLKDIINRGGMKISPAELDSLLEGYPGIVEVAVCAFNDEELGERVGVCVVMQGGAVEPTLTELCHFLQDKGVAKFKWPERLRVVSALPRNPLGKVLRHELSVQ